ncbi:hypothetical protein [Nodosilinea nodulosa]|nr:hypothetical protein [Nodosilinea nodulosa]
MPSFTLPLQEPVPDDNNSGLERTISIASPPKIPWEQMSRQSRMEMAGVV